MAAENQTSPEFSRILLIDQFLVFFKIICKIKKKKVRIKKFAVLFLQVPVGVASVADWCTLLHHRPGAKR